jgi:phosphoadenosine phosphosulfate reductase
VALIDMLWRINPTAKVVTLDTLRLHTETYGVVDAIRQRYKTDLTIYYPDLEAVDRMVRQHGYNCFYASVEHRKLCCGIRKVEPLEQALFGLGAWITGLRRDQAATRTEVQRIELDEAHVGKIKVNPLADWTSDDVWSYIREHHVPYNALHDQGFPSIGCAPCTRAVRPDEDPRAGRWWWESDPSAKECGIHVVYDESGVPRIVRGSATEGE